MTTICVLEHLCVCARKWKTAVSCVQALEPVCVCYQGFPPCLRGALPEAWTSWSLCSSCSDTAAHRPTEHAVHAITGSREGCFMFTTHHKPAWRSRPHSHTWSSIVSRSQHTLSFYLRVRTSCLCFPCHDEFGSNVSDVVTRGHDTGSKDQNVCLHEICSSG